MARRLTCGWESGSIYEIPATNNAAAIVTSHPRTGSYNLRVSYGSWISFGIPGTPATELYGGHGFKVVGGTSDAQDIIRWLDDVSSQVATVRLLTTGKLAFYVNGVQRAQSVNTYGTDQYIYLEWHIVLSNDAGVGKATFKVNGVQECDYTGDTIPTTGTSLAAIKFSESGPSMEVHHDDLVVNDTSGSADNSWPGQVTLIPFRPSAAGDVTQLLRGGTDSGANWSQVDEVPSSSTDYVYETTVDKYDLYATADPVLPAGMVPTAVTVVAMAAVDAGSGNLQVGLKSGGTEEWSGVDTALGTAAKGVFFHAPLDPADAAWNTTKLNALQIGVKVR